eukprot:1749469-Amphidinium_carterae.1
METMLVLKVRTFVADNRHSDSIDTTRHKSSFRTKSLQLTSGSFLHLDGASLTAELEALLTHP